MYNYGFRDASRWQRILQTVDPTSAAGREAHDAIFAWKGETQNASPLLWVDEGEKVQVGLYNLGWQVRPRHPGRPHHPLARLPQRHPVVRRRARDGRRRRSARRSPTSTSPPTRARTCTTATGRTSSTSRWA